MLLSSKNFSLVLIIVKDCRHQVVVRATVPTLVVRFASSMAESNGGKCKIRNYLLFAQPNYPTECINNARVKWR